MCLILVTGPNQQASTLYNYNECTIQYIYKSLAQKSNDFIQLSFAQCLVPSSQHSSCMHILSCL